MQTIIHARGFKLSKGLAEHIKRRLQFALSRSSDQIRRVQVRLADVNGPRGGVDKRCSIEVQLERQPAVVIEQMDSDLYAAISHSAARAGRRVAGKLKRVKSIRSQRRFHKASFNQLAIET